MRPILIQRLNDIFHTDMFLWLIPHGAAIYAIAFVTVLIIFVYRSSKVGLSRSYAFWSGIWAIAFGLIGSRFYYIIEHMNAILKAPSLILTGGSGSLGGYIGGTIGLLLSLKLYHARILEYIDVASSTLGLGIFIARWSCFFESCCYGAVSSIPWAVRFPNGSMPYNAHITQGLITPEAQASLPVHPVQIYASLNGLILFILASWYWKRLRYRPGITFCLFWLSYCITRFGLEFLRGDGVRDFVGLLSTPQLLCLMFIPMLTFGFFRSLMIKSGSSKIHGGICAERQHSRNSQC